MNLPERCTCPECVELDALPERLQGIPGAYQMRLLPAGRRMPSRRLRPPRSS